jgi:hypothetical protein
MVEASRCVVIPATLKFDQLCDKLQSLGYAPGCRVRMYGQEYEICSAPFENDGVLAVRAIAARRSRREQIVSIPLPIVRIAADSTRETVGLAPTQAA